MICIAGHQQVRGILGIMQGMCPKLFVSNGEVRNVTLWFCAQLLVYGISCLARFNRQRGSVLLMHQKYPKVLVTKMGLYILFGFSFISSLYLRGVYIMAQPFLFCRWGSHVNEYDMMLFAKRHPLQLIGKTIRHAVICEHQWNNDKRLNCQVGHDIFGRPLVWRR